MRKKVITIVCAVASVLVGAAIYLLINGSFSFEGTSDLPMLVIAVISAAILFIVPFFIIFKKTAGDCPVCGAKYDIDKKGCCKYCGEHIK